MAHDLFGTLWWESHVEALGRELEGIIKNQSHAFLGFRAGATDTEAVMN